jgi:hypothetical protein
MGDANEKGNQGQACRARYVPPVVTKHNAASLVTGSDPCNAYASSISDPICGSYGPNGYYH